MKLAPLSWAIALANIVLPQPGGPYSNTPAGTCNPTASNRSGFLIGCIMENSKSSLTSCKAPMSSKVTLGAVAKPSRLALGCTFFTAAKKSSIVTDKTDNSSLVNGPLFFKR